MGVEPDQPRKTDLREDRSGSRGLDRGSVGRWPHTLVDCQGLRGGEAGGLAGSLADTTFRLSACPDVAIGQEPARPALPTTARRISTRQVPTDVPQSRGPAVRGCRRAGPSRPASRRATRRFRSSCPGAPARTPARPPPDRPGPHLGDGRRGPASAARRRVDPGWRPEGRKGRAWGGPGGVEGNRQTSRGKHPACRRAVSPSRRVPRRDSVRESRLA
jgi:hypothetical protein